MPKLNTDGIPQAEHMAIGMCEDPQCGKLHLIMFDKHEKPLAVGAISDPTQFINTIQDWAYIAATRRV